MALLCLKVPLNSNQSISFGHPGIFFWVARVCICCVFFCCCEDPFLQLAERAWELRRAHTDAAALPAARRGVPAQQFHEVTTRQNQVRRKACQNSGDTRIYSQSVYFAGFWAWEMSVDANFLFPPLPQAWNHLLTELKLIRSTPVFKRSLKTLLQTAYCS